MITADKRFENYKKVMLGIIHKHLPDCKVYLFGSRARGTHQHGADIDLALDCGMVIPLKVILKIYDDIEETSIPLMVDLVDIATASDLLKNEIKKEGIEWKNCC